LASFSSSITSLEVLKLHNNSTVAEKEKLIQDSTKEEKIQLKDFHAKRKAYASAIETLDKSKKDLAMISCWVQPPTGTVKVIQMVLELMGVAGFTNDYLTDWKNLVRKEILDVEQFTDKLKRLKPHTFDSGRVKQFRDFEAREGLTVKNMKMQLSAVGAVMEYLTSVIELSEVMSVLTERNKRLVIDEENEAKEKANVMCYVKLLHKLRK